MSLDLTPLQNALTSLVEALESTEDSDFMSTLKPSQQRTMRAGVIQNFEFCYELSWKALRRYLKADEGEEEISPLSRRDLFRLGAQKGLLDDPELWFSFHRARNETSHTYDEVIAEEVYEATVQFLPAAQELRKALEARL